MPHVILDVSRIMLFRSRAATPTGIDRIEAGYARMLLADERVRTELVASRLNRLARIPAPVAWHLLSAIQRRWNGEEQSGHRDSMALARWWLRYLGARTGGAPLESGAPKPVYIKVAHQGLEHPARYRRIKAMTRCRFVVYLHDLIPINFPEYVRRRSAETHAARMATIAELADLVVVNSDDTGRDFLAYCRRFALREPAIVHIEPAIDDAFLSYEDGAREVGDYFVCLGTIEPRKNHLLLLELWREFAAQPGRRAPKLVLVGGRGWKNENVLDMLERCPAVTGLVEWHRKLPDATLKRLIVGARALLLPSFAEGYGMPVAEALALRVPVLCSDLPALRESGQNVPEYLDPLDGIGWRMAILDYANGHSVRRASQLQRATRFQPMTWDRHIERFWDALNGQDARAGGHQGR